MTPNRFTEDTGQAADRINKAVDLRIAVNRVPFWPYFARRMAGSALGPAMAGFGASALLHRHLWGIALVAAGLLLFACWGWRR